MLAAVLVLLLREGEELRREGELGNAGGPLVVLVAERGPVVLVLVLSLREKLGWWAWPFSLSFCDLALPVVLCDQRFTLAAPSLKAPRPSAAPLAALERRLAPGGGVACLWGLDGSGFALASRREKEADRLTVTTDDDEMEALRDGLRTCEVAEGSAMLESCRRSGRVSQAKPAVNAMRMQAWRPT